MGYATKGGTYVLLSANDANMALLSKPMLPACHASLSHAYKCPKLWYFTYGNMETDSYTVGGYAAHVFPTTFP